MVCWGSVLGDCSDEASREHLVSQGLFESNEVVVQGLPWCRDAPKRIGLANLTTKILCRKHNSELSPVDQAGAAGFDAMRKATRLSNERGKAKSTYWHIQRFNVDGPGLER